MVYFTQTHSLIFLQGYQIPKGWNVIYSICDTHDVAEVFPNKDEFQPERFMGKGLEDGSRFNYIPFGGGSRMCVGKEFAKVLLKIFLVELTQQCNWILLNGPPTMKTGPTVYPVDNLPTKFSSYVRNESWTNMSFVHMFFRWAVMYWRFIFCLYKRCVYKSIQERKKQGHYFFMDHVYDVYL